MLERGCVVLDQPQQHGRFFQWFGSVHTLRLASGTAALHFSDML
jgi:hypothetical protein